jgi:predicted DNA-binding protein with PD1-like motif
MELFRGATAVEYLAVRLDAGDDVIECLNRVCGECSLAAGAVIAGQGTLEFVNLEVPANLLWPPAAYATRNQGPALIVSAQGHIVSGQVDLHLTVARRSEVHAGKAMPGTRALHGVEFSLLRAGNTRWNRVPHPVSGVPMLQAAVAPPPDRPITLMGRPVDAGAVALVPRELMRRHQCLGVARTPDTLIVAMTDPNNPFAIDDLRQATGLRIQPVAVSARELLPALQQALGLPQPGG